MKISIPTVCYAHKGIIPSTWDASLIAIYLWKEVHPQCAMLTRGDKPFYTRASLSAQGAQFMKSTPESKCSNFHLIISTIWIMVLIFRSHSGQKYWILCQKCKTSHKPNNSISHFWPYGKYISRYAHIFILPYYVRLICSDNLALLNVWQPCLYFNLNIVLL